MWQVCFKSQLKSANYISAASKLNIWKVLQFVFSRISKSLIRKAICVEAVNPVLQSNMLSAELEIVSQKEGEGALLIAEL